jgi:hypothetical protein
MSTIARRALMSLIAAKARNRFTAPLVATTVKTSNAA